MFWEVSNIAGASEIAFSGCWSVQLSPCDGSTLLQTIPVQPDCCYKLSYYLRCLEGEALAAARIEWLTSNGQFLDMGGELFSELNSALNDRWQHYQLLLPPVPEECAWARISFTARGGTMLLDQVSLTIL